jgi:ribosomal-protein-alanine N-acetyltransferase
MQLTDLDGVIALEEVSFPQPWPRSLYEKEIRQPRFGRYFVIVPQPEPEPGQIILGHGGYWRMEEDIHIVTIAVDPAQRGQGMGRWLLLSMLERAREEGGQTVSLEVRPSNQAARKLYKGLGFQPIGKRRRYYANGEDALILELTGLDRPKIWRPLATILAELVDQWSV